MTAISDKVTSATTAITSYGASNKTRIKTMIPLTQKGTANGVVPLDANTKIVAAYMPTTDALTEGSNLYFTQGRVLATPLTGLVTTTNATIAATDTVLGGLGKIQKQITDLGLAKPTTTGSIDAANQVGGYSGIRFTQTTGFLRDNGTTHSFYRGGATNADLWYCDNTGSFIAKGDIGADSDERLKSNWIAPSADFLPALAKVKHGTYDRVDIGITQVGVGAQSLQMVPGLEFAVRENEDTHMLSVSYGQAAMVAVVQLAMRAEEQATLLADQMKLNATLVALIEGMQERLAYLERGAN